MKRAVILYLTGKFQVLVFNSYIKENAERNNLRGFLRNLEDGRIELFLEGDHRDIEKMIEICRKGTRQSKIEKIEQKDESFQYFKEFKILHI
ncbi:acylphosphatase [Candidatus Woesearchaeota archaeon]|nr:acylphosphatase [Candidatus Woesearchaeota archaeon]